MSQVCRKSTETEEDAGRVSVEISIALDLRGLNN